MQRRSYCILREVRSMTTPALERPVGQSNSEDPAVTAFAHEEAEALPAAKETLRKRPKESLSRCCTCALRVKAKYISAEAPFIHFIILRIYCFDRKLCEVPPAGG